MRKKVVIATHVFTPGTSQAFKNYCNKKKFETLFIGHSVFGNVLTWGFGTLDTFWKVLKTGRKYDLYVGFDNLNAFVGIQLKKLGRVKKIIFMTPDYSHTRFKNPILNNIYHLLDYYCLRNSDFVWNSSSVMVYEREKRGISKKYRTKQIMVPDGTDVVEQVPFAKRNRYEIVFVGHLKTGMGLELLISEFRKIQSKIPKAKLLIIGSGPIESKLRQMAKGLNIEFTGFIGNLPKVYKLITKSMIAVAPYEKNTLSENTDPGKVKLYLSAGLPMVITKVPLVALEIAKEECGIAVNPSKSEEFGKALLKLLTNENLLKQYIKNTQKLTKKYAWDNIFDHALKGKEIFIKKV